MSYPLTLIEVEPRDGSSVTLARARTEDGRTVQFAGDVRAMEALRELLDDDPDVPVTVLVEPWQVLGEVDA